MGPGGRARWSRLCKLSLCVVVLKNLNAKEKQLVENSKGICHPFGTKKTSSQHSNLYLESAGCVSSSTRLIRCFLGPFHYYSLIPKNYAALHTHPRTHSARNNRRWKSGSRKRRLFKFVDYRIHFKGIYCFPVTSLVSHGTEWCHTHFWF